MTTRAKTRTCLQPHDTTHLGNDGAQIDANSVSRAINRHFRDLGIDATAHQLRHRYGTVAYQLSKDLRMVQEQMGHASADTTAIYTRPSVESARRMVQAMDGLALPAPRAVPSVPGDGAGLTTERTAS